jgi:hypothetical protein
MSALLMGLLLCAIWEAAAEKGLSVTLAKSGDSATVVYRRVKAQRRSRADRSRQEEAGHNEDHRD